VWIEFKGCPTTSKELFKLISNMKNSVLSSLNFSGHFFQSKSPENKGIRLRS
jgi:hypothetical protein